MKTLSVELASPLMLESKGEEKKLVELDGEVFYKFIGKEVYITVDGVRHNIRDLL